MKILSKSAQDTFEIGYKIGQSLVGGEIIQLSGRMGSGKTVFTKGLASALGISTHIVSPTFSILNVYDGRLHLCHYDCYRLSDSIEATDSGLDEYFGQKSYVCVIEWAENIKSLLDSYVTMRINLQYIDENQRQIEIIGGNL